MRVVKDNIFVNLRTGAGSHMAVRYRSTTLPNPTTLSSDYNLYLAGSSTAIRYFNGSNSTDYTLAGWQVASGQDPTAWRQQPLTRSTSWMPPAIAPL